MAAILTLYGTGEGQTASVADRVVDALRDRGHDAEAVDVADLPADVDLDAYDAVLVGASIHGGTHQRAVRAFVDRNRERLEEVPTGFFQVSLTAALEDEASQATAAGYVDEFVAATGWHPDRVGVFGGALRYSEYGFLERLLIKQIAKRTTGDTDTSRDYEYTDWAEVEAFAADFAAFVEGRLGVVPPDAERTPGSESE
jgi:menaquinone-dependent protoporphyrinogen oxidase